MNAKEMTQFFAREWAKRYRGETYPVAWSKDPSMFKRLLGLYPADRLQKMILLFLHERKDQFAEKTGHKIEVFVSSVPDLIAALSKSKEAKPSTNPDYERLEKARAIATEVNDEDL